MDSSEKQGHLGDLSKKTSSELNEVLKRQQKLLKNVKFINKLPDKGERIQKLTSRINAELESRMEVDATADLFHQMALNAEKANRERGKAMKNSDGEDDDDTLYDPLKEIINRALDEKQITDNRNHISEKNVQNSYEKVIKRAERNYTPKKKFYPHKTVKAEHIDDLTGDLENIKLAQSGGQTVKKDIVSLVSPPPLESPHNSPECKHKNLQESRKVTDIKYVQTGYRNDTDNQLDCVPQKSTGKSTLGLKSENPKLKHRYDESLEMSAYSPSKKYVNTQLISIEESIDILERQRKKQELLQAQHAGDRLAQRLGIKTKMVDFEPKHQEMRYRGQTKDESDTETSDSDGEELDYPE